MSRFFSVVLMAFALAAAGCESNQMVKDSWKFTKRQYSTYLNTPASLDMEDKGSCEVYELALSEAVMNIDAELQKLIRAMENSDHNPNPDWVMSMMNRTPWISGVALVDGQGAMVAQYPEQFAKDFDVTPLLEADPKQRVGSLRAYVQMHAAGPEVYVANPVYGGDELKGLIVAYFDPAALATMSNDPGGFVLASPQGILWSGRYSGSPMASVDWEEVLKRESCGIVGDKDSGFFWTTRYVGNLPLVYGLPVNAAPTTFTPSQLKDPEPAPQEPAASPAPAQEAAPPAPVSDGDKAPEGTQPAPAEGQAPEPRPENGAPQQRQDPWQSHEPDQPSPAVMDAPGGR